MKTRPLLNCLARRIFALVLAWGMLPPGGAPGAAGGVRWLVGGALENRLARPIDVVWSDCPLRQAIVGLSEDQQVAVLLDRRVDPGQKLDLKLDQAPLRTVLQEIAHRHGLGLCTFGPVTYFGPPAITSRLSAVAAARTADVRRLPPAVARRFLQPKAISWQDFATPRELLEQLARQNAFTLKGLDRVPHDLWARADLPPLSLADRLTLIAAEFDLTFAVSADGKTVTLVPLPAEAVANVGEVVRHQPQGDATKSAPAPQPLTPARGAGTADLSKIRVSQMSVREIPLGQLLEELAKRWNLDLRIDRKALADAGVSLDERVSLTVQNVTVDELFDRVTRPARLQFRRRGNVLEIEPVKGTADRESRGP